MRLINTNIHIHSSVLIHVDCVLDSTVAASHISVGQVFSAR